MNGTCKALVCSVGPYSTRGIKDLVYDVRAEPDSMLSDKLENIGGSLKFFGLLGCIAVLVTSTVVLIFFGTINKESDGKVFMKKFCNDNLCVAKITAFEA